MQFAADQAERIFLQDQSSHGDQKPSWNEYEFDGHVDFYGYHSLARGWFICGWMAHPWPLGKRPIKASACFPGPVLLTEALATFYYREDVSGHGIGFVYFFASTRAELEELQHLEVECSDSSHHSIWLSTAQCRFDEFDLIDALRDVLAGGEEGSNRHQMLRSLLSGHERRPRNGIVDFYGYARSAQGWLFAGRVAWPGAVRHLPLSVVMFFDNTELTGNAVGTLYQRPNAHLRTRRVLVLLPTPTQSLDGLRSLCIQQDDIEVFLDVSGTSRCLAETALLDESQALLSHESATSADLDLRALFPRVGNAIAVPEDIALPNDRPTGAEATTIIHLDRPRDHDILAVGSMFAGAGWAVARSPISRIDIYLDEQLICYASYGTGTPEVGEFYPSFPQAESAGFSFTARLPPQTVGGSARLLVKVITDDGCVATKSVPVSVILDERRSIAPPSSVKAALSPIKIAVEHATVRGEQLLRVSGWVVSLAPLQSLELLLGGHTLEAPEQGLPREDVATNYPDYPNAMTSGFKLIQDLSGLPEHDSVLRVRATVAGGLRRQVILPLTLLNGRRGFASEDNSIHVCVDTASVQSDGVVLVVGWAVAPTGIRSVKIDLDGQLLGTANYGHVRQDVGNRFPRVKNARRSGFSFTDRIGRSLFGEHLLTVNFQDETGGERVLQFPLLALEVAQPDASEGDLGNDSEIRCDIDSPALAFDGDRAREPVRGALSFAGWALSAGGLASIEIFLDDQSLGLAYIGVRREDVAALFPNIEGALLSGFALTVPHHVLGEGEHNITIVFRNKTGTTAERRFAITVETNNDRIATTLLRHKIRQSEVDLVSRIASHLAHRPAFLVIIRLNGRQSSAWRRLGATLESLDSQAFRTWQALIVLGPRAGLSETQAFLQGKGESLRSRVAVGALPCGGSLNDAVRTAAPGQDLCIGSLDAGDLLGTDALLRFAAEAGVDPDADFIYSDERRTDPNTSRVSPFFKPDWSPDLLMSANYIGRAWIARASLLQRAGVDLAELASRSHYDLALRLTEMAREIRHIPQILVDTGGGKAEAPALERGALRRALVRRGIQGEVAPGRIRSTWRVNSRNPSRGRVSIVIPTCAARGLIKTCIESIRERTAYGDIELIVVDNIREANSEWKTWIRENADTVVEILDEFNWSRFNNIGARAATGEFLLFLNDDIEVLDPLWLQTLVEQANRPEVGVVGPQLLYPNRKVQHAGMFLAGAHARHAFRFLQEDDPGYFGLALTMRNVIAVTGACMLMRRDSFERAGGFDEAHSIANNDLDYCLRVWSAGQRVVYTPFATLIHHELASRAKISDIYDKEKFVGRWGGALLRGDPYFNANLSPDVDAFAVESEPLEVVHAGHPLVSATEVKAILAVKLDHIGDFITALPAFRRLKLRFPGARLSVLAPKASKALAAMEPAVDEVIEFEFFHTRSGLGQREVGEAELEQLRTRCSEQRFDIALDLRVQPDTRHILQHTGARLLAGFDHGRRFPWLDVPLEWEGDTVRVAKRTHITDQLLQLVEATAVACDSDRLRIAGAGLDDASSRLRELPAIAELPAGFLDKPLVCVHPAVGNDTRQWPEEHFAGLIDLLVAEEGVHVVLIGGPDEIGVAEKVMQHVQHPASVASLLGRISLRDLPLLLKAARLYVGNNSGPKHLAAALGTPTIGIHSGVVDANEWGPSGTHAVAVRRKTVCSPCYIAAASDCHRQLACLRKLLPGDVFRVCRGMLALGREDPPPDREARKTHAAPDTVQAGAGARYRGASARKERRRSAPVAGLAQPAEQRHAKTQTCDRPDQVR